MEILHAIIISSTTKEERRGKKNWYHKFLSGKETILQSHDHKIEKKNEKKKKLYKTFNISRMQV